MSGGWGIDSWDSEPWTEDGRRDSWPAASDMPLGKRANISAEGNDRGRMLLAAGGGAVAATGLGLLVLVLGGVIFAVLVGCLVLLGACAVVSAYLRGVR